MKPESDRPLRLMLVDDHALVMAGYARLLALESDLQVVSQHTSTEGAFAELARQSGLVDLLVVDLSMPGRGGLDLMRRVRGRWPRIRLLVCTMHDSPAMVQQALQAGADGFITKCSDPAELPEAVRRVARGERVLSADAARSLKQPSARAPHECLSPREFDVFVRLARGDSLERIAATLNIASKTAANVQAAIRAKLGLSNAVELVHYARSHHIG